MLDVIPVKRDSYKKSERFYRHLEDVKEFHKIKGLNETYWKKFESNSGKTKSSLFQYKSAVKRFIDIINKDVLLININELQDYIDNNFYDGATKKNQERYLKSFIIFTIENNINKALKYTNKDLMLNLMPREYKMLIQVLMNKN